MKMKTKQIVKRVVPIALAVIMLLSVITSGLMSMTTAYAADNDSSSSSGSNMADLRAKTRYNNIFLSASIGAIPGEEVEDVVTFTNNTTSDIKIEDFGIASSEDYNSYFTITPDESSFTLEAGKEYDLKVSIYTREDAPHGTYTAVKVKFICDGYDFSSDPKVLDRCIRVSEDGAKPIKNPSNVIVEGGDEGYTEMEGSVAKPRMDIKIASSTPTVCKEGDTINLVVLLTYSKDFVSLQSSSITISSEAFSVINGMVSRNLKYESYKYNGSEKYTKAIRYQMQTKENLTSGYYPVTFKVEYYNDEETQNYTSENTFNIYIEGSKEGEDEDDKKPKIAKPKLIVEQYNYESETGNDYIMAGETFSLKMVLRNTSDEVPVENVLVKLTAPEQFTLTNSSNTIYLKQLGAGGSIEKELNIRAKSNAPAGSHAIAIEFSFEYLDNEERLEGTTSESIAIPVIQRDRFEVGEPEPPMMMYVGEESGIELTFVNKGTTDVRNITAVINGNIQNPGQSQYIGNLPAGEESSASFSFAAVEAGLVKASITLSYEDSNDIQREVVKEFTVDAQPMPTFEDPGMGDFDPGMMEPENTGFRMPVWGWILIGLGGAGVIIVIIVIIRKKRKAKKAQEDDDEDI